MKGESMNIKSEFYMPQVTHEELAEVRKIGRELMDNIDHQTIDFILTMADALHNQAEQLGVGDGVVSGIFHAGMVCERNRALKLCKLQETKNA